jgi:aldose 1-epimerase
MNLSSTEPGWQSFQSPHFTDAMEMPDSKSLHKSSGNALEPQTFHNSPNRPDFPSPWLNPGETYKHVIEWEFS